MQQRLQVFWMKRTWISKDADFSSDTTCCSDSHNRALYLNVILVCVLFEILELFAAGQGWVQRLWPGRFSLLHRLSKHTELTQEQ